MICAKIQFLRSIQSLINLFSSLFDRAQKQFFFFILYFLNIFHILSLAQDQWMAQRPLHGLHQQFNQLRVHDKDPKKHTFYYGDKNSYYFIPIFQQNSEIKFGGSTYEIIKLKRRTETALIYQIQKSDQDNKKILIEYQFIFDLTKDNENYKYYKDDTNDDNDQIKFRHLCRIAKMRDEENQQGVQLIRFISLNNQNQENKIKLLDQLSKEQLQQIEYNQIYVDENLNIQIRQRQQNVSCFVQAPVAISQIIPYQQTFLIGFYHSLLNNSTIFNQYLNMEQNLQLYLKRSQAPLFLQQQIAGALKYNYKLQIPKNTLLKELKQLNNQKLQVEQQQKVEDKKQVDLKIQENQQQLNKKEKNEQKWPQSMLSYNSSVCQGEGQQEHDNKQQLNVLDIIKELIIIDLYSIQIYSRNNDYNKSPFFKNDYTDYLKKLEKTNKNPLEYYEEFQKIKTNSQQFLTDCHLKILETNINIYFNYITQIHKIDTSTEITKYEHLLREKFTVIQHLVGEVVDIQKKIADYSNQKELVNLPRYKAHAQLLDAAHGLTLHFKEFLHDIDLITLVRSESALSPILDKALDQAVELVEHSITLVCAQVLQSLEKITIEKNDVTVGLQDNEQCLITQLPQQTIKKGIEPITNEFLQEQNARVEFRNINTNNYNRKSDSSNWREILKFINSALFDQYLNIQPGDIDIIDVQKYICKMQEVFGDQYVSEFNELLQQLQKRQFSEVKKPFRRISTETKEFNEFISNSAAVQTNDDSINLNNSKQLIENLKLFDQNNIIDINGDFEKQIKIDYQQIKDQHTEISKIQFKNQNTKNEIPSKPEVKFDFIKKHHLKRLKMTPKKALIHKKQDQIGNIREQICINTIN